MIRLPRRLLDLASPRRCHVCGCRLAVSEDFVCPACMVALPLTFHHLNPYENPMARMLWGKFAVERTAALYFYHANSLSSKLIYDIKYYGHRRLAYLLGRAAAKEVAATDYFCDIDTIIPVPLSRQRQRERGYNQSEMIALGIGKVSGIAVDMSIVRRTKDNPSQTSLSPHEREENVRGIFSLVKPDAIRGRHVLLVDDVMTTGATLSSCARTLAEADGVRFSVMTIGTTMR